jgi:hypothetical protein
MEYEICHDFPAYLRSMKSYAILYFSFYKSRMLSLRHISCQNPIVPLPVIILVFAYKTRENFWLKKMAFRFVTTQLEISAFVERHVQYAVLFYLS